MRDRSTIPVRPCLFTDEAIQMVISKATSELGYSALRPMQESAIRHFLRGSDVFVSLPTGSGKSSCYCLLSRAFDFLRQRTALRESIVSSRLCHGLVSRASPSRETSHGPQLRTYEKHIRQLVHFTKNIGYHLLQKWQNKLAGRTKYFPTFGWLKKDVPKRTAKYIISRRHIARLY